jgi:AraC-like DNA-binding protein
MRQYSQFPDNGSGVNVRDCGNEACDPRHSFGPAVRDYYLMHIVSSGKGVFQNAWGRFEIAKGQGFMIFPHEVTVYTADTHTPWVYSWVGYSGEKAAEFTQLLGVTPQNPVLSLGEYDAKAVRILRDIYEDSASLDMRDMAAMGGLYRLFALIKQSGTPTSGGAASASERYYQRAYWHMEANYQRNMHITDVAAFVGLSRSQLFRVFVTACGMPPQRVLLMLRLKQAESLLKNTGLPLKAVAVSSGFSCAARMGEVFKTEKGVTPMQFRKGQCPASGLRTF